MIAALAGGSLPFILRTVMQPEKPEIEIGTVSFKNQMDEIIKNFVQCWPIYDLPFDVYTAEEEEKDRRKKEEEEQLAAAERTDRSLDVGERVRVATPGIPKTPPATDVFLFESAMDTVDGQQRMDGNHVGDRTPPPQPCEAAASAAPIQRVCFDVDTKDDEPDVDIVIYLPMKHDDTWLDEWSDLDDDKASSCGAESLDNPDVFAMTELA